MHSNIIRDRIFCLFLISFILLFSGSVSAQEKFLGTYKQHNPVILSQTCDDCTYVNLTKVKYPNSSEIVINQLMNQVAQGNFQYEFQNTQLLDYYIVTTCGNPSGTYTCENYKFRITTTGNDLLNTLPLFLLIAGFLLFALAIYEKSAIVGFGSGVLLSIAGVYTLIYGLGVLKDVYTDALAYVSLFIGIIICFASIHEQMQGD